MPDRKGCTQVEGVGRSFLAPRNSLRSVGQDRESGDFEIGPTYGVWQSEMSTPLRDADVRQAVHTRLLQAANKDPHTLVVDELGLNHGASRIDIAVINGHIRALEIKAEADDLSRLAQQAAAYGLVVDKATLIAAERHIEAALAIVPDWWGAIAVVKGRESSFVFRRVRPDRSNRSPEPVALCRLLWRPEAEHLLRNLGTSEKLLRAPRSALYTELASAIPTRQLRHIVRETLKARRNWRDRALPSQYADSRLPNAKY
jgi:hypothetical protein